MVITFSNWSGSILGDDIARVWSFFFVVGVPALLDFLWNSDSLQIDYYMGLMAVASSRHLIRYELDFQYFVRRKLDWSH
jgi:hypothetical protein